MPIRQYFCVQLSALGNQLAANSIKHVSQNTKKARAWYPNFLLETVNFVRGNVISRQLVGPT
jgi:hypothetical protein